MHTQFSGKNVKFSSKPKNKPATGVQLALSMWRQMLTLMGGVTVGVDVSLCTCILCMYLLLSTSMTVTVTTKTTLMSSVPTTVVERIIKTRQITNTFFREWKLFPFYFSCSFCKYTIIKWKKKRTKKKKKTVYKHQTESKSESRITNHESDIEAKKKEKKMKRNQ